MVATLKLSATETEELALRCEQPSRSELLARRQTVS